MNDDIFFSFFCTKWNLDERQSTTRGELIYLKIYIIYKTTIHSSHAQTNNCGQYTKRQTCFTIKLSKCKNFFLQKYL